MTDEKNASPGRVTVTELGNLDDADTLTRHETGSGERWGK